MNTLVAYNVAKAPIFKKNYKAKSKENSDSGKNSEHFNFEKLEIGTESDS